MSRVELIEAGQAPLLARPFFREDGSASPLTRALAQVPELIEVAMPFIGRVYGESALDLRTKELVVLRVSANNGCRYCVDTHTVAAWDAGLEEAETAALRAGAPAGRDDHERALVTWCDAFSGPGPVPDEIDAGLRERFAGHEVVELALVAGATVMLNRFCTALELPPTEETLARLRAAGVAPS